MIYWESKGQTIANRGNIFGKNYFYLSVSRLTTVSYIAFSFAKLTESFVYHDIKTKTLHASKHANTERSTEWFAFQRLLSNRWS